jgi:hypothetical protein
MVQFRRWSHNGACCALIHAAAVVVAFAPMRVSNARFASATLPCRTWRKGSFGPLSADAPRSSRTPSTNVLRATCATSASDAAPSAIIFAESWVSAVLARTASSRSCSVICWIWRCSLYWTPRSILIHRNRALGRDMTPCSHRAWTTPCGLPTCPTQPTTTTMGPPSNLSIIAPPFLRPWRSSKQRLGSPLCFVRCSYRARHKSAILVRVGGKSS